MGRLMTLPSKTIKYRFARGKNPFCLQNAGEKTSGALKKASKEALFLKMGRLMTLPSKTIKYRFARGKNPFCLQNAGEKTSGALKKASKEA